MQNYLQVYGKTGQPCPRCSKHDCENQVRRKRNTFVSSLSKTMIIGLTGGIASGKSTVVEIIKDAGYKVIDADQLVHDMQVKGGRLYKPCLIGWEMGFFFLMGN